MQGLVLLNFHSKENKKSASELCKATAIPSKELTPQIESLVSAGILKLDAKGSVPIKYQVNENFNMDKKEKYISLLPSVEDLNTLDEENLKKTGIS